MLKYVVFVAVKDKSDPHDYQDLFAGHLFGTKFFGKPSNICQVE